ncbi:putative ATP-dependent DNA helicase HFM1 [Echinococcus granulosus]|nr:putative ATP-dependent DNA helicase HFM1 [Echinococcus granulosus]
MQAEMATEILQSDFSYVISAPTGSGKTVIFELAICKFLPAIELATGKTRPISLYLAPLKSLCSERMTEWHDKLKTLGYTCLELTSDSPHYETEELMQHTVLIATPEKIDSLLRFQEGMKDLVARVTLLMVDEIHTIADQSRGACLEAVIMRFFASHPRILAATATCPNISDIAQWLSTPDRPCLCRSFGSQFRPVPITKIVLGYRKSPQSSLFQFDQFLTKKLLPLIRTYSQGRPTLIFSITRKTAENTAEWLARGGILCSNIRQELVDSISGGLLKECLSKGVGFHHAGVSPVDRRLVEEAFVDGCIPVLVSTSTLSMGINLPAHLVIIKNTALYVEGSTQEYTTRQMLQMIGRAGRPQFSTSATAVIMTTSAKKEYYEHWLEDAESVESRSS